ncbi:MAG: hypothetical protein JO057_26235, partial [Chloroflexi bacterium]|nr:hypothetical protein [Chloroflexota bacterium]
MNRRQFIERTSLAAGALVAPAWLEACAPAAPAAPTVPSSTGTTGTSSNTSLLPTYVPFPNKPTPDFPSSG